MKHLIQVFKSANKDEMYLYVEKSDGLKRVPDALMERFGKATSVMLLPLTDQRKLARADATEVLKQIDAQGFYLQMPPAKDDVMDETAKLYEEYCSKFDQDPELGGQSA
ncbi:hypothetical protein GH975_05280 [Litorivicinus lipolyticus]|uniref:YcgL domain-containing protein GH975_05280 n=1 Tax=Litorivicinus lipolyticus TaxID=418701 RepID=A0A5Q2QDT8_9GAMM|nr:YcgL domain-containing protein [Litorivicinus lipolyticus]QGG80020.1 hypothetical protein GH975_05280 [Litorivicinus lipolyticus]